MQDRCSPINTLEDIISELSSIYGNRTKQIILTKKHTFPILPETEGGIEDENDVEKIIFVSDTLNKTLDHLMEARKLLFLLGYRFEENT